MYAVLPDIPSPPTLCAPVPAMLLFRAGLAPDSLCQLSAVLRTSLTSRSLVSRTRPYRVRFVSLHWTHLLYGLSVHFQLLSPSPRGDAVTFCYWCQLHQRGTLTLLHTLTPKRTR